MPQSNGLVYPVDFASSGSSQIGGNVSTNAGGIKVIRHGMTRDWVAGLKVVNGTGELLDLNRGLVKNNAGYDLRQLVIGAEGTSGGSGGGDYASDQRLWTGTGGIGVGRAGYGIYHACAAHLSGQHCTECLRVLSLN